MKKGVRTSMQRKLLLGSLAVTGSGLVAFLAAMIWIIASLSARHREDAVDGIRKGLVAKGNILVSNNAQALGRMVEDNAVLAVAELVASTVRDDPDLAYGIFMDAERQAWVVADSGNPEGRVVGRLILDDSSSLWAAGLARKSYRLFPSSGGDVYEFASPVQADGRVGGVIRYGLSTRGMRVAIEQAAGSSRRAFLMTLGAIGLFLCVAVGIAFPATQWLSRRLTHPLRELQGAANAIAGGDYAKPVSIAVTDDEIGQLADDFETMRIMVKNYTERLQAMVAEKVREIRDILEHIGQGLFTVNLDGKVNPDYARSTNAILRVENVAGADLSRLFRMDKQGMDQWMDWLQVVRLKHGRMGWDRLVRLSPLRELRIAGDNGDTRIITVTYEPMLSDAGELNKLMVLVQDVTEARRAEAAVKREKELHELEVRAILGIVRHANTLPDFFRDAEEALSRIQSACDDWIRSSGVSAARDRKALLARELHTVKGIAATYGFEKIARACREAELLVAGNRQDTVEAHHEAPLGLAGKVEELRTALAEVRALARRLSGHGDDFSTPIPTRRLEAIRSLCDALEETLRPDSDRRWSALLKACRGLDGVRLGILAEKYGSLLDRVGDRLGKRISFRVRPESLEMAPRTMAALDGALAHLFRNAADHGIEGKEERLAAGKEPDGLIELIVQPEDDGLSVTVSDDGRGIDAEKVTEKAITLGLRTREKISSMSRREKEELIFLAGLSTGERSDDISGMGQGMAAVAAWVASVGGRLSLSTRPGSGTRIEMRLPSGFESRRQGTSPIQ